MTTSLLPRLKEYLECNHRFRLCGRSFSLTIFALILSACAPAAVDIAASSTPQVTSTKVVATATAFVTPEAPTVEPTEPQPTSTIVVPTSTPVPVVTPFCAETIYFNHFNSAGIFDNETGGNVGEYVIPDAGVGHRIMLRTDGTLIADKWPLIGSNNVELGTVYLSFLGYYESNSGTVAGLIPLVTRLPSGSMVSFGNGSYKDMTPQEAEAQAVLVQEYLLTQENWVKGAIVPVNFAYPSDAFFRRYNGNRDTPNARLIDTFYQGKNDLVEKVLSGNLDARNCLLLPWIVNLPLAADIAKEIDSNK